MARVIRRTLIGLTLLNAICCARPSDVELQAAAIVRLRMDPAIAHLPIDVSVSSGVARLTGETDTRAAQHHAIEVVKSVSGVQHVANELRLSDHAIRIAVQRALAAEPVLAGLGIAIMVERGVVRLEGGGTDRFQRARAVGTTAQVDGVVRVQDYMR